MMRALALIAAFVSATAALSAASPLSITSVNPQPGALVSGQGITVIISINNSSTNTVANVSTTVQTVVGGSATAVQLAGPSPTAQSIAGLSSASFTWVFQSGGCGSVAFTAWATGYDNGTSALTTSAPTSGGPVLVNCPTPTVTPTVSPTATATPWIIYVTPVEAPKEGDASIPGNLFHPDQGQPLQLKFSAPAEGEVVIELFNRLGQRVRSISRSVQPGSYTELWDGRNDQGLLVAAGIYVAQFRGKGLFKTVKFAVIK